ncbi:hypothetical protein JXO59_15990, partial [candidate division KSB1 bacterium]|nr:hypothetical protein [candidate division KSB1 bacterium]
AMAMAKAVYSGILQQCRNQHTSYIGTDIEISLLLASLKKNGLPDLQALSVYWPEEMASDILLGDRNETIDILCKTLFMFNDREILRLLRTGCKVEFTAKSSSLFVDLSNRSRFLNLSYERPRQKPNMKDYLRRLPRACSFVRDHKKSLDTIHVFLVHHITSETLSLIQGSADMGSASIRALFVKYAGTTPAQYLEALAECSEEHYAFYALQPVSSPTRIDDFFVLSDQYSDIKPLAPLNKLLREKCLGFFDAMALVAGHLFFLQAARCRERGQKLVIVEDGGYIAPHLQSICLNKMKMFQVLQQFALPQDLIAKPQRTWTVQKWLNGVIIGSVEHTRNGYDALQEVLTQHNKLAFPSCSIAISDFKINQEAQEVAYSCINAIETILAGLGLVLTHRHAMILGSRGAIGSKMMRILSTRLASDQICGIDIKVKRKSMESTHGRVETHSIADLPKDYLYQTDLFIGVIGKSILNRAILEDMLFNSRRKRIIFVSGSTKTAEFTQLIDWLRELGASRSRLFKDRRLTFSIHPIKEPQFAYTQGRIVRFEWIKANGSGKTWREFLLLGGLQPINFLYYGVPSETMDRVMMELLATTAELVEKNRSGNALPPRLLALDHDIRL